MYCKISYLIVNLFVICQLSAMEDPEKIEKSAKFERKVENPHKALVIIQAIQEAKAHVKVKPSITQAVIIHAKVNPKLVEQQERQYTEEEFYPFFIEETAELITIKPYIPGQYTVYLPQGAQFRTPKGSATFEISTAVFAQKENKTPF